MEHKPLTLGSLFDGSGGFPLGGLMVGITPVWASEIEPFPIRVTTRRFPNMKHYGDISHMDGGKVEPVDIITFGSPCTDMSIAGRRAGLDGNQSCLFYEAIRIIQEMRTATNGEYPKFIVWENVPGAFSSNQGQDFRSVLEAVIGIVEPGTQVPLPEKNRWPYADCYMGDGWSVAYRTLDAQYWGVPQRRRRVYLVADFTGQRAGRILFESEGLSGYSAEGFRAWQRAARNPPYRAGASGGLCLNDQGGQRMSVTEDATGTLRAEARHPPVVMEPSEYAGAFHINQRGEGIDLHDVSGALMASQHEQMQTFIAERKAAGFCTEHSAASRGVGYEEETAPTLRAGKVPAAVYENHSQDTRYTGPLDTAPTVSSTYGTGGNNQPFVVEADTPKTLKIRSGCEGGGKGALIQEDVSATLGCNNDQTVFVPFRKGTRPHSAQEGQVWEEAEVANTLNTFDVGEARCDELAVWAFGICSLTSNGMLSDNPHSGFYEASTSRTLDKNGGTPLCNQGGMVIVEGPTYAVTMDSRTRVAEETTPTLMARDFKGATSINSGYLVRRLTPTECARLQGFPDWWCDGLDTPDPSEEELAFWTKVWETHRNLVSHASRPKSRAQLLKWLAHPHSDAAEYKMWGNGVALPCVFFVLAGIVYYAQE